MPHDLIVLSHLRWNFVWQRPQHLISRVSAGYDRTWFVEEPEPIEGLEAPRLRVEESGPVTRVWIDVPADGGCVGYDATACDWYERELPRLIGDDAERTVWLYTPMPVEVARSLRPTALVYDVMDDLAAFRFAPRELVLRQRQALREADVVFAGGRTLHQSAVEHGAAGAHCFPSGVEPEHYAPAIAERRRRGGGPPVAGYVGVIDERIDLDLVRDLAGALPEWEIRMVGPVLKIDPASLPQAPNLVYPGSRQYAELPSVMAGFDVGLMPFALNEATRSISPTKTLEYLAAGLPVVSTRVPDVVADYTGIVHLADDAPTFADACQTSVTKVDLPRLERCRDVLASQHWDAIAGRMSALLESARKTAPTVLETA
jgi:glycosyltransferase involved in cell wall biosynthesis